MIRLILAVSVTACVASASVAANRVVQPEPAARPSWSMVRAKTEAALKDGLFDPESAQFKWTSGFEWGEIKPALKPRIWAWVGCVSINARNRLGGYTGAEPRYVAYTAGGGLVWGRADWAVSQCSSVGKVPVQPELLTSTAGTPVSDQLTQLASLLDRGLITRAEFDAQKTALLSTGSAQK